LKNDKTGPLLIAVFIYLSVQGIGLYISETGRPGGRG